jgi:hypothetical protein
MQVCDQICMSVIWTWHWRVMMWWILSPEFIFERSFPLVCVRACVRACKDRSVNCVKKAFFLDIVTNNVNCICIGRPKNIFSFFFWVVWGGVGNKVEWLTRWLKILVILCMSYANSAVFQWLRLFGSFCTQNFPCWKFISLLHFSFIWFSTTRNRAHSSFFVYLYVYSVWLLALCVLWSLMTAGVAETTVW